MRAHLTTIAFLVLALVLYAVGAILAGTVFFVLGIIAECIFWYRVLRRGS